MGNCRSTSRTKQQPLTEDGDSAVTSASRRTNASLRTSTYGDGCHAAVSSEPMARTVSTHPGSGVDEHTVHDVALVQVLPTDVDGIALLSTPVDRFPVNPWSHHVAREPHNTSMTTPYVQSMFAYPESPQLLGPRNTDEFVSSRQRTGSLPPGTTPMSPSTVRLPSSVAAAYVPITQELLEQFDTCAVAQASTAVSQERCPAGDVSGSKDINSSPLPAMGDDDAARGLSGPRFVAARRQASIQHVLSWMKSDETFKDEDMDAVAVEVH